MAFLSACRCTLSPCTLLNRTHSAMTPLTSMETSSSDRKPRMRTMPRRAPMATQTPTAFIDESIMSLMQLASAPPSPPTSPVTRFHPNRNSQMQKIIFIIIRILFNVFALKHTLRTRQLDYHSYRCTRLPRVYFLRDFVFNDQIH